MTFPANNFNRSEFACKCGCGMDTVDAELLYLLNELRRDGGRAVHILSGNRCEEYNEKVGGAKNSNHLISRAADIMIIGVTPYQVFSHFNQKYPDSFGLGLYKTFVHVDTRDIMARW